MIAKKLIDKIIEISSGNKLPYDSNKFINHLVYDETKNEVINSRKILEKGQLITILPHTRYVHFPEHSHDFVEVMYVCRGKITHIIGGNHITVNEGELMFLGQNTRHEIMESSERDIAINFIIMPEFFDSPLAMMKFDNSPLKSFITDSLSVNNKNDCCLHFKISEIKSIQNLVENLIDVLINKTPNKYSISSYTMGLLLLQLVNQADSLMYKTEEDSLIIKVLKYIEENYRNSNLNELAKNLHYDYNWLSREIKNKTGKTYTELVQDRRLSQSCFFLKNTNMNIVEIAENVGYDNISYFHRLFYKTYGLTPREYRIK